MGLARSYPFPFRDFGFRFDGSGQDKPDGSFPTVKSPNRENAGPYHGMALAEAEKADLVGGTDPDSDRMSSLSDHGRKNLLLWAIKLDSL
jgi:phosphomannomutase